MILGAGRLMAQKYFVTLASAFALVCRQRPCRLPIIREGEERGRVQILAAMRGVTDAVKFVGFHPDPLRVMREAQLLLMASCWDGFGNVLAV